MKVVMTLLVRDEEDILRENIDFHLKQGVDHFIVTDNLSLDSTRQILREYETKGKLTYIYEADDNYNQHKWVTRMARMAFDEHEADWVINNDADEFWWPIDGNLRDVFSRLPPSVKAVEASRNNFVFIDSPHDENPFYRKMIYKELLSLNPLGGPLPPKIAHKGSSSIIVRQGNHRAEGIPVKNIQKGVIEIFHFPIRSYNQFQNKIINGGAAYARNNELPQSIGNTWRTLYKTYQEEGNLENYVCSHRYSHDRLIKEIGDGRLVSDTRLRKFIDNI
jgi:hypothetical protein